MIGCIFAKSMLHSLTVFVLTDKSCHVGNAKFLFLSALNTLRAVCLCECHTSKPVWSAAASCPSRPLMTPRFLPTPPDYPGNVAMNSVQFLPERSMGLGPPVVPSQERKSPRARVSSRRALGCLKDHPAFGARRLRVKVLS